MKHGDAIWSNNVEPRDVDDLDSKGITTLAEKIASGKMSVTAAVECSDAFTCDGANKVGWSKFCFASCAVLSFDPCSVEC